DVLGRKIDLPLVVRLGLLRRSRSARLPRFGLLKCELIGLGLNDKQHLARLHGVAVLVFDLLQEALHARDQRCAVYGRSTSRGIEIARDRLLYRERQLYFRGRGRNERIFLAAT